MDAGCKLGKLPFPLPQASGEMGHSGPFVPQGTAGCKKVLFPLPHRLPATRTCAGCLLVSHTSPADPNPPSASELGASGLQLINDCACGGQACVGFHHMVLSSPRGWVGGCQSRPCRGWAHTAQEGESLAAAETQHPCHHSTDTAG